MIIFKPVFSGFIKLPGLFEFRRKAERHHLFIPKFVGCGDRQHTLNEPVPSNRNQGVFYVRATFGQTLPAFLL